MTIRGGELPFEEILAIAEALMAECEAAKATCGLPDTCDVARASDVLRQITDSWERRAG